MSCIWRATIVSLGRRTRRFILVFCELVATPFGSDQIKLATVFFVANFVSVLLVVGLPLQPDHHQTHILLNMIRKLG